MPRRWGRLLGGLSVLAAHAAPAWAQEDAPGEAPRAPTGQPEEAQPALATDPAVARTDAANAEVTELRQTVTRLESRIAALEAEQKDATTPAPAEPAQAEEPLSDRPSTVPIRQTFRDDHTATPRPGNAAGPPDLDGFFAVGATGLWLKLGGYIKLDLIVDSAATGNPNKFVTSTIVATSDAGYDPTVHFNMHAKQSRLSFEARTKTMFGSLRVVYENDFFGDAAGPSMTYNLRHFYGQIRNLTIGQTWTPYLDTDAMPDTLDVQGPGVQGVRRSPQVRYTLPFSKGAHLALAIEQPGSDIGALPTDAAARNLAPDFTLALRLEDERLGHVHLGGLVRVLSYEDVANDVFTTGGSSMNLSAVLNTVGKDHLALNVTVGQGTGHYAQDLGSGNAALVTADGDLQALLAWGGFASYRHFWVDTWTSQITYGYLALEEHEDLPASGYRQTHYAQGNLVWSPEKRFHVGVEYLYGHKTTQDGSAGDDHRGQMSFKASVF